FVYLDGLLFMTAGFPEYHVMAIRPDGSGNVTKSHVAWHHKGTNRDMSYVPSPVAAGHWFFLVSDTGMASCYETKTGNRLWLERLGTHHSASPVSAGGYLYFTDDEGVTFVLKPGPTFELVAKNELGEECYASPAVAHEHIFIRTLNHLWCIGENGKGGG